MNESDELSCVVCFETTGPFTTQNYCVHGIHQICVDCLTQIEKMTGSTIPPVLVGEKISIAGKFKSDLLGKEVSRAKGETVPWRDPTATHISRSFDSYRPNFKGIQSTGLTANVIGQSYFKVNFNLEKIPKKVFCIISKCFFNASNPSIALLILFDPS